MENIINRQQVEGIAAGKYHQVVVCKKRNGVRVSRQVERKRARGGAGREGRYKRRTREARSVEVGARSSSGVQSSPTMNETRKARGAWCACAAL